MGAIFDKFIYTGPDSPFPVRFEVTGSDLYIYRQSNGNLITSVPMPSGSTLMDFADPDFVETFDEFQHGNSGKYNFTQYIKALRRRKAMTGE